MERQHLHMSAIENALARLAYALRGWRIIEQRGSIFVLRKGSSTMMCHGLGTIYSFSGIDSRYSGSYWDLFLPLPGLYNKPRILMIGLGGGTISRQISALYKDSEIDAVEIDRNIAEMAEKHFEIGNARIIVADGADFVKHPGTKYDILILDAFKGSKVPEAFMGADFFRNAHSALAEEGILAINYMGHTNPAKALAAGFHVYSMQTPLAAGNSIAICSKSKSPQEIKARVAKMKWINNGVKSAYRYLA